MKKSTRRKPPGNSTLKTLPDAVKEELFQLCDTGTQREALEWLKKEHGIETSDSTLSKFYAWYADTRFVREGNHLASNFEDWVKDALPSITPDELADIGQQAFLATAIRNGEGKEFDRFTKTLARLKNARANESRSSLAWKRLEQAARVLEDANRTPEGGLSQEDLEKIQKQLKLL